MLPCQPEWNESFPSGPVAQLGARFHGMEEVIGSIPIRSTKSFQQLSERNPGAQRTAWEQYGSNENPPLRPPFVRLNCG